jgi:hypothetical protein
MDSQYKRDGASKLTHWSSTNTLANGLEVISKILHCRTESNPCPGRNLHCVSDTPSDDCAILFHSACDLRRLCELIEMKSTLPIMTTTLTQKYASFKHLPMLAKSAYGAVDTSTPTPEYCSSITRPCKEEGKICIISKDAPCRWLVLGVCDLLGICGIL